MDEIDVSCMLKDKGKRGWLCAGWLVIMLRYFEGDDVRRKRMVLSHELEMGLFVKMERWCC